MGNRTFFKNVKENKMNLMDIFSDVGRKHTPEETASVFIAGTELTTPKEENMLAGWLKPFLFARFFLICLAGMIVLYFLWVGLGYTAATFLMMVGIPFIVPVTVLLLVWEMHIPRNISLFEIIKIVGIGGILSIFIAIIFFNGVGDMDAVWAGVVEEPAKLILIYYFVKKKDYKYILDGILVGVSVGTGFAAFESVIYTMSYLVSDGIAMGILVALVRAFTAIAGHGLYAGLYGGALMMAKGREELRIGHLLSFDFLKYFAIAIVLHAFHNMGIDLGLPTLLGGLFKIEWAIEIVIAVAVFMNLLKLGVNQIVEICTEVNGGRVTRAVERDADIFVANMNPASGAEARLDGVTGVVKGKSYRISVGKGITIGRAAGRNDISLPSCKNVSSMHCQVGVKGGRVYIKDLNSTNGTYLGEQRLTPYQEVIASDGAILYLGDKNCGFRIQIQ